MTSTESSQIITFDGWKPRIPTSWIVDRIVLLAEKMLEKKLYSYQKQFMARIAESVLLRDGEHLSVLMARQAGKSTGVGGIVSSMAVLIPYLARLPEYEKDPRFNLTDDLGHYRGYRDDFRIGIYGPKQEQAEIIFSVILDCFHSQTSELVLDELGIDVTFRGSRIVLSTGALIRAETASESAKIEGSTYHLLIADEAQDISDERMEKSLSPMLSSTHGSFVKVGSANPRVSDFFRTVRENRKRNAEVGKVYYHFEYDWEVAAKENSLYAQFIDKERLRHGENSDYFQMSYCCRFLLDRGMFVSERIFLNQDIALPAPEVSPFADRLMGSFKRPWSLVAGIDFAKKNDSTVVTVIAVNWETPVIQHYAETLSTAVEFTAYSKHVVNWLELHGDDYETQFFAISEFLSRFRPLKKIVLDSSGLGEVLLDRYRTTFEPMNIEVEGYVFSSKSKSELYRLLHTEICGQRITFPYSPKSRKTSETIRFVRQLLDLQKEYKNNILVCNPLPGPNSHDDYPASLALAVWAAEHPSSSKSMQFSSENFFFSRR